MRRVLMTFVFVQFFQYLFSDCIVGETWYEKCRKCKCNINQKPKCEVHSCNSIAVCPSKMIWMSDEQRCYCDRPLQHSVCVDIEFQKGICNEGDSIIDNCFNCTCTHTRFLKCVLIEKCWSRENKEGKCPTRKNMLFDLGCIIGIDQECHYDYECPDEKKCCQVTECSFRCQKPVIDN
ncbi:uncharacterized protein LOC123682074 isoform X3 [Harmonia axyridis]|uniref:uncharacterized protein LOC123682074 isoform X3 n=1 Tax=Harmonia axyridis TaxID=115357 RepID=UPI001E2792A0|nr:uncharacterized protein LOC123682074 isoform X3 [Harmonia axyridis]